jgi:hypothetical protein
MTHYDIPMCTISHDDIHLYHDTHELRASSHEKVAEVHLRLLKEKIEMGKRKQRMKCLEPTRKYRWRTPLYWMASKGWNTEGH